MMMILRPVQLSPPPPVLAAAEPIVLDDPRACFYVEEGAVDLFVVRVERGLPQGVRRHFCSIEAGRVFFGMAPGDALESIALLAAGDTTAKIRAIDRAELFALSKYDPTAAASIEAWVRTILDVLPVTAERGELVELKPGEWTPCASSATARPRMGLVWVRPSESFRIATLRETPFPAGSVLPLSEKIGLTPERSLLLEVFDTGACARIGCLRTAVDQFHAALLDALDALWIRERDEDSRKLQGRAAHDARLLGDAITRLAALSGARAVTFNAPIGQDPLIDAFEHLAEKLSLELTIPTADRRDRPAAERIEMIARASRFRVRRVALSGEFWRADHGAMLVFRASDQRPLALLSRGAKSYQVWDPVDRSTTRVTAKVAATFASSAFTLHRSLPARKIGVRDLLAGAVIEAKRDLGFILAIGTVSGLFGLAIPISTQQIFDRIIPSADRGLLLQLLFAMLAVALADRLLNFSRAVAKLRAEMRMSAVTQAAVWDRVLSLPAGFFRPFTTGDLAGRVDAFNSIRQRLSNRLLSSVLTAIFALWNFGFLFYLSVELALLSSVLLVIAASAAALSTWIQLRHQRNIAELEGKVSGLLYQLIRGISQIRSAAAEARAFTVWSRIFAERRATQYRASLVRIPFSVFQLIFPMLSMAVLYATFATWLDGGEQTELTTGRFLAFYSSFAVCAGSQLAVVGDLLDAIGVVPLYERAKPILDAVPEVTEQREHPGELNGELEVNQLSFRYTGDQPMVLDQLSFRAGAGEMVAIVGASGSGKSTLLRLLLGFETPSSGAIYYAGLDLSRLDVREVRRQCGVVLQNGKITAGTIFENVDAARGLSEAQVWEALEMAALAADVRKMPAGLATEVPLGGGTLSGGQCQRLLIARAIATKPRILLLDEATSALDTATQSAVTDSLERLRCTRIVIAHRLSTIRNARRILVLEGGRLVQSGTFEELARVEGPFAKLAARQLL